MNVNRSQLADILGVSINTITNYLKEGMPSLEKPGMGSREYTLDSGSCVKWLVARAKNDANAGGGDTLGDARTRVLVAEAGLKELDLAERQGELIKVDDAVGKVEEAYAVVKSRLLAIPGNLSQALSIISNPQEIKAALKREVDAALTSLSGDLVD